MRNNEKTNEGVLNLIKSFQGLKINGQRSNSKPMVGKNREFKTLLLPMFSPLSNKIKENKEAS